MPASKSSRTAALIRRDPVLVAGLFFVYSGPLPGWLIFFFFSSFSPLTLYPAGKYKGKRLCSRRRGRAAGAFVKRERGAKSRANSCFAEHFVR